MKLVKGVEIIPGKTVRQVVAQALARIQAKSTTPLALKIGAQETDSQAHDPSTVALLGLPGWHQILFEPWPAARAQLERIYAKNPLVTIDDRAVGEVNTQADLYFLLDEDLRPDSKLKGQVQYCNSLDRGHISHCLACANESEAESKIRTCAVTTATWATVVADYGLTVIDYLQIDAEGFDFKIFKQLNLAHTLIRCLCIEVINMTDAEKAILISTLLAHDYRIWTDHEETYDLLAIKNGLGFN